MAWIQLDPSRAVIGAERERRERTKKKERKKDRGLKAERGAEGGGVKSKRKQSLTG